MYLEDYVSLRDEWIMPDYFKLEKRKMGITNVCISVFIYDKGFLIPSFFKTIENFDFSKTKINMYIGVDTDENMKLVLEWMKDNRKNYGNIKLVKVENKETDHEKYRNESLQFAKSNHSHYLYIEHHIWLKPETLKTLFDHHQNVILAPMLRTGNSSYSNFHCAVNQGGYYADDPSYPYLISRAVKGIVDVPVIKECYLLPFEMLDKVKYHEPGQKWEYITFSNHCRGNQLRQCLINFENYGNIVTCSDENDLSNEPFFKEYQN